MNGNGALSHQTQFASPATFTEGTGAIEGTVTDDQLHPLAGAEVAASSLGLVTQTDQMGRFTFSNIEPGPLALSAAKVGYESATKRVSVEAGTKTAVAIALAPLPSDEPYHVVAQAVINVEASVATAVCVPPPYPASCPVKFIGPSHWVKLDLNRSSGIFLELAWVPGTAISQALNVSAIARTKPPGQSATELRSHYFEGVSPLRGRIPVDSWLEAEGVACAAAGTCELFEWLWAKANPPNPAGAFLSQRLNHVVTTFYNGPLPLNFTALPEG